jgi:hypothetical protein
MAYLPGAARGLLLTRKKYKPPTGRCCAHWSFASRETIGIPPLGPQNLGFTWHQRRAPRLALSKEQTGGVQYLSGVVGRLLAYIDGLREPEENRIALEQYTQRVALQWAQEDER